MPELVTLSQSSLQDYADCPRRFQLRYIDRLQYPAIETEPALENEKRLQEGEYFHRLVHQSLLGLPNEKLARLANSPNLTRWWENFTAHHPELDGCATYPELTLSAPLGKFRLVAKYDLIATRNGHALIYDWKTYRKRPRNEWLASRWQTRVYRALLTQAGAQLNGGIPIGPEQIEMVYWFADYPTDPARFVYDVKQFKRDWDGINKLADEIASASNYPKTADEPMCRFCAFRSYCNRGSTAGLAEDADAEMEAEELFDVNFEQIGEIAF
jgi:CRISPR/Cas system-associated exonuclease Cas4 (RecB family)